MSLYNVIGLMSGTSLDGVDVAYCRFRLNESGKWHYDIVSAKTYPYTEEWREKLSTASQLDAIGIIKLHTDYGHYLGKLVNGFIKTILSSVHPQLPIDLISSHGHTIFHQPDKGFTCQAGDGSAIAAETGITTVCDFRSADVALGGQGAPLVPIGDRLLFSEYDFCLNLGGFANISFESNGNRSGFDICPVNIILNLLANQLGLSFDDKGKLALSGKVNTELLNELNLNSGIHNKEIKRNSLSREWLEHKFLPIVNKYSISIPDKLRTITEHISMQIADVINNALRTTNNNQLTTIITGGGASNDFLIKCISEKTKCRIEIPDAKTIEFKEALIFAFLGVLRMRGEVNCLKSVTGASRDNSGGAIYVK